MVKKGRFPFGGFGFFDDNFEKMFERMMRDMQEGFGEIDPREIEKMSKGGKSYVRGYSINIGPDGKPTIREFGDKPSVSGKGTEEREPLVDVITEKMKIKIIAEIPGVSKDDIDLNATKESLEIKVSTSDRKYHKALELPVKVKPETAKASYKNGVLEVTIERSEPEKEDKKLGRKINVK